VGSPEAKTWEFGYTPTVIPEAEVKAPDYSPIMPRWVHHHIGNFDDQTQSGQWPSAEAFLNLEKFHRQGSRGDADVKTPIDL